MSKTILSKEKLGIVLRKLRNDRKLPLRKVAALLDIDIAILSKMERGERNLTKEIVKKLAKIYDHEEKELMVTYLRDIVIYEIGEEELAILALQAAEAQIEYKSLTHKPSNPEVEKKKTIEGFKSYFQRQHLVSKAWIFGSFARGDDTMDSDIDVVIDVPEDKKFTFFDLAEVQDNLENVTNKKVDVVMLKGLRPAMQSRIKKDMLLLYEA